MDNLDGKGVNENGGDIEKMQMDSGAKEKDNFDGHDYDADGSEGDENSHGGDYCDHGGVGCDEDADEVSEDADEASEDADGDKVSDDDNNGNYDGNDDCDDLTWSPEFIDNAYKVHVHIIPFLMACFLSILLDIFIK